MVLRARVMMLMLFVSLSLAAEERREVDTRPRRRARGESRVAGDPQLRACALWEEEGSDDPFVLCPAAGVRAACGVRRAACGVRRAAWTMNSLARRGVILPTRACFRFLDGASSHHISDGITTQP